MAIISLDSNGILVLPSNIVIGLIAICMTCSANKNLQEQTDYFLTLNTSICIYSNMDFTQDPIIVHCYVQKGRELKFELSKYFFSRMAQHSIIIFAIGFLLLRKEGKKDA